MHSETSHVLDHHLEFATDLREEKPCSQSIMFCAYKRHSHQGGHVFVNLFLDRTGFL